MIGPITVSNGPFTVDEDGFLSLVDASAYRGFVDEDWTFDTLTAHLMSEARAEHAIVLHPGADFDGSVVRFGDAPRRRVMRSHAGILAVSQGRIHLCDYTALTMAAQFSDDSPVTPQTPWIDIPNGRYLVTVREVLTRFGRGSEFWSSIVPVDAEDEAAAALAMTSIPWMDDDLG